MDTWAERANVLVAYYAKSQNTLGDKRSPYYTFFRTKGLDNGSSSGLLQHIKALQAPVLKVIPIMIERNA
jgi:hypothetical protein